MCKPVWATSVSAGNQCRRNGVLRQAAERTAINAPMQGTAADIIKMAMLTVDSWLAEERPAKAA